MLLIVKNRDGKLLDTVSSLVVEYMLYETIPENENETPKKFKMKTDKDAATIVIKVGNKSIKCKLKWFSLDYI